VDELEHDAHVTTTGQKAAVEAWLADGLKAGKVTSAHDRPREIMLLMEGAMALMLIDGNRDFANAAAKAQNSSVGKADMTVFCTKRHLALTRDPVENGS
jgi:hypothetical protein